jgi:hypothetical protein
MSQVANNQLPAELEAPFKLKKNNRISIRLLETHKSDWNPCLSASTMRISFLRRVALLASRIS